MLILSIGFVYFVEDLHGQGLLILEQCFCIQISENHNSGGLVDAESNDQFYPSKEWNGLFLPGFEITV